MDVGFKTTRTRLGDRDLVVLTPALPDACADEEDVEGGKTCADEEDVEGGKTK